MDRTKPELPPSRIVAYVVIFPLVIGVLLFLPAGTFDWPLGWLFLAIFLLLMLVSSLVLWRLNPEIFEARRRIQRGTKDWDQILASCLIVLFTVIPIVAAFETVRFGRAALPGWAIALGYLLLVAGFAGMAWAQAVNRFFEPGVRIQTERGHRVIDTGPYTFVRHPGYVAAFPMLAGTAPAPMPRERRFWCCAPPGRTAHCRPNCPAMRIMRGACASGCFRACGSAGRPCSGRRAMPT